MSAGQPPNFASLGMHSRRGFLGLVSGGGAASLLPACSMPQRGPPVPLGFVEQATVLGVPNERFFLAKGVGSLEAEFEAAVRRQRVTQGLAPDALPAMDLLAVSGGGEN